MVTRNDLAELSRTLEGSMVLSVYVARENEDPGRGQAWRKRLEVGLADLRADIEARSRADLADFERAVERVMERVNDFGRILPHEGWCTLATADRIWLAEGLEFRPPEMVRWRLGATVAPYVRALKSRRPAILAVLSQMHANLYRYQDGELTGPMEIHAEAPAAEAGDVGVSKRAATTSGVRGTTRTDYVKRTRDENVRRLHKELAQALVEMAGNDGGVVVLGGTQKAISAVRNDLEATLEGRIVEVPEIAFDSTREELVEHVRGAVSWLTHTRQSELLESCGDPHRGSTGWNETYLALAAGAVDTLLVARSMITEAPEDAERLVRLALAQGADVEEVAGEPVARLQAEDGGVAARLRFVPTSLQR